MLGVKGNEFAPLNIVFADIDRRNDLRCVLLHSLNYPQIFTNPYESDWWRLENVANLSQFLHGTYEETAMTNGDDFRDIIFHAIDDAIIAKKNLPDIFASKTESRQLITVGQS